MRHHYTCIFRDVLTSRVWASSPATKCVWLWLRLAADPEGFVVSDLAGVALGAGVSLEEARAALAFLESVDIDADPEDPEQGRCIERVGRGWQVLGFEEDRERAKHEAQKARNRRYMRRVREAARANDIGAPVEPPVDATEPVVEPDAVEVDQPKSKPKTKPPLSEEGIPPTPHSEVLPVVLHRMPADWQPSDELRAEASIIGVKDLDSHIARLRLGPIGGTRGVLSDQIDDYIRLMLPKLRTFEETDRAKAARAAAQPSAGGFRAGPLLEPNDKHRRFADAFDIDLAAMVRDLNEKRIVEKLGAIGAQKYLEKQLASTVRERRERRGAA